MREFCFTEEHTTWKWDSVQFFYLHANTELQSLLFHHQNNLSCGELLFHHQNKWSCGGEHQNTIKQQHLLLSEGSLAAEWCTRFHGLLSTWGIFRGIRKLHVTIEHWEIFRGIRKLHVTSEYWEIFCRIRKFIIYHSSSEQWWSQRTIQILWFVGLYQIVCVKAKGPIFKT